MDKESVSVLGTDPCKSSDNDPFMDVNIDNIVKESIDVPVTNTALAKITEKQPKQYSDTTTVDSIPHKAKTGLNQPICDRHAYTKQLVLRCTYSTPNKYRLDCVWYQADPTT